MLKLFPLHTLYLPPCVCVCVCVHIVTRHVSALSLHQGECVIPVRMGPQRLFSAPTLFDGGHFGMKTRYPWRRSNGCVFPAATWMAFFHVWIGLEGAFKLAREDGRVASTFKTQVYGWADGWVENMSTK